MTLLRRIQIAVLVGTTVELAIITPFFILADVSLPEIVRQWMGELYGVQLPGESLALLVTRTDIFRRISTHLPPHWWVYLARGIMIITQSAIFSVLTLGIIFGWQYLAIRALRRAA
jgi:branched-subunit amino acid transport protein AzlD